MVEQIIICQIPTYHICFWSLYTGGLLVLIYVTFFHHIYDMDIWKLKNVIPLVLLSYCSQGDLCILITIWKVASTFRNWANLYAIHPWNFFYILTFITRIKWWTWAICTGDQLEEWEGSCIQKYHHRFFWLPNFALLWIFFKNEYNFLLFEKKHLSEMRYFG